MTASRKGLGRGLSALIPESDMDLLLRVAGGDTTGAEKDSDGAARDEQAVVDLTAGSSKRGLFLLSPGQIEPNPYQPRRSWNREDLQELVASVKEHGVLQPVLVRRLQDGYQLIAGERRWRAAQEAGLDQIPAVIREVTDREALELAVVENLQRRDISALEAARAYRQLSEDFHLSQEQIAGRVGKSRPSIANTLRLLELPEEVQKALEDGAISEGHGRAILQAEGDGARRAVFRRVLRERLSVRDTEELSRSARADESKESRTSSGRLSADLMAVQGDLQKALGTRVTITGSAKTGSINIRYSSSDELERLLNMFPVSRETP